MCLHLTLLVLIAPARSALAGIPYDANGNGVVDLDDYRTFASCLQSGGPGSCTTTGCMTMDGDLDCDVDLVDFAGFQTVLTAPIPVPANDSCSAPTTVSDGSTFFSNLGATTDGPDDLTCHSFGESQIESDIWFCHTAACESDVVISLCGSEFDTKLAVYEGCACPTQSPIACSDDDCGIATGNVQSRVVMALAKGQQYLIRIGGFPQPPGQPPEQGAGRLTIACGDDACLSGSGDCFSSSPNQTPGCGDPSCCAQTCELDQYCCDVNWDSRCAAEAKGACTGEFPACSAAGGPCGEPHPSAGCNDADCCNTVCAVDPFCCLAEWDFTCVNEAQTECFLTCTPSAGGCLSQHPTPGCNVEACCRSVCMSDPYCCNVEWDRDCVDVAGLDPSCQ